MTPDECLSAAWTHLAPNRAPVPFPRGFWPDVARVAVAMMEQQTEFPVLDFRPTMCERGSMPERMVSQKGLRGIDLGKMEINL
jgi:hypothetical protein